MRSSAYEEDTHFLLTYVICRSAGFTRDEALTVAAVDQGMDDSKGTDPVGITSFYVTNQWHWHALDRGGNMGASGILKQKAMLFQIAQDNTLFGGDTKKQLIWLGVFFHYQQDTWAHRHHYAGFGGKTYTPPSNSTQYTTYNTPFGHAKDVHQPDRPPYDPVAAIMDLEDGIVYARTFLKNVLHRQPTPFLADYNPMGGKEDDTWSGKGYFLHQLASDGAPGSARRYLTDLIRAQISAYTNGYDVYFVGYTSNEADYSKMQLALRNVCASYAGALGWEDYAPPSKVDKWSKGRDLQVFGPDGTKGITNAYLEGLMGRWRHVLGFDG
jgi:hypothetical protein